MAQDLGLRAASAHALILQIEVDRQPQAFAAQLLQRALRLASGLRVCFGGGVDVCAVGNAEALAGGGVDVPFLVGLTAGVAADDGKVDAPRSRAPVDVTLKLTDVDADTCDLFTGRIHIGALRACARKISACRAPGQQGGQEQTDKKSFKHDVPPKG